MAESTSRRAFPVASAAVGYAVLAVVLTWPLVLQLSTALPHDLGDPLLSTSILWWNAHVMPLTQRWWDGFTFFPATGTIAFSDHRLGESLLATPLQWLGANPVTAYNLTLLATFPLCALAAHWLAFTLTRRNDASLLCGLAYGFNPYRMAHLEHLELLAAFGMPAALAGLHLYVQTERRKWLIVFGAALILQALCTSYYALFFGVLLCLWTPWFLRWPDRRTVLWILLVCICGLAAVTPIGVGYWRIHQAYGLARTFREIQRLSADLSSLVTASPLMALWGWTAGLNGTERQLFPGATVVALAVAGLRWRRSPSGSRDRLWVAAACLAIVAVAFAGIAVSSSWLAPWKFSIGAISVSVRDTFKPLSVAIAALFGSVACHPAIRAAYRSRSPYGFYFIATGLLYVCSFGPTPAFLGQQILYRPPYAWLMHLPLFADSVRVPARFAMPAVLTLSVAAALAFDRLAVAPRGRRTLAMVLAAGMLADGWIHGLPLPSAPDSWPLTELTGATAVLELPTGDPVRDSAAVYRATRRDLPAVNGLSGFDPLHYVILRLALDEGDRTVLDALAESGPILIAVDRHEDRNHRWSDFVGAQPGVTSLEGDERWAMFRLARTIPPQRATTGEGLPIVAASDDRGPVDVAAITDTNPRTGWFRSEPQYVGETLQLDLGRPSPVSAVVMSLAGSGELYPRLLNVATSLDGRTWDVQFAGRTGGRAFRAVLDNPLDARLEFPLASPSARFVRLLLEQPDEKYPWIVTDVVVKAAGRQP